MIIRNTCSSLLRIEDLRCSIYRSQFIPWNNFIHDLKKFFSSCLLFTTAVLNVSKRSLLHFFCRPYLLALLYITFYRFVHGFDSIRGSLRNPVLILANHHIVIVHKQYIRFFLLCCLPSVSVFFMSVFPILHGFFIQFSFFIIGQIKYKVGQPFLKRWILLAHMVA